MDKIQNEIVLERLNEKIISVKTIWERKGNLLGHNLERREVVSSNVGKLSGRQDGWKEDGRW